MDALDLCKFLKLKVQIAKLPLKLAPPSLLAKLALYNAAGHMVSKVYKLLISETRKSHKENERKWEKEINSSPTKFDWVQICKTPFRNKFSPMLSQTKFMIINRPYWTPNRLHTINLIDSPMCWNCSKEVGDLAHIILLAPTLNILG